MSGFFKDKIFAGAICVTLLASGTLAAKKIAQFVNAHHHASQSSATVQAPRHTYTPIPQQTLYHRHQSPHSLAQRSVASSDHNHKIPTHKARPKNDNVWLVGTSSNADSNDLKTVFLNLAEGDSIQLEAGTYPMNVSDVTIKKLQIIGEENVIIEYVDSYKDVLFNDLTFKDLQIDFSKVKYNHSNFSAYDSKITFEKVKAYAAGKSFRMVFSGNMEFEAKFSEFKGITLNLDASSKAKIVECLFEKTETLFDLEANSQLDIQNSTLQHFEWSAFKTRSSAVKIQGNNITVSHGREAFYGKFTAGNVNIQHSKFSNIRDFQGRDSDISCYMCEKENVQN